jgi:alpha-L-rhamnosidase
VTDPRPDAAVTAVQVRAAGDADRLPDDPDLWDSGEVASADPWLAWDGPALRSRQHVAWCVRTRDADGDWSPWSMPSTFELGLLTGSAWRAALLRGTDRGDRGVGAPGPLLRRSFELPAPARRARLHVAALGLYEARLNGRRVGDDLLRPGWTDYRVRIPYQTYDVTDLLRSGENVLGALLGDGWYCGRLVVNMDMRATYGERPGLLAQLEVETVDGETLEVATGDGWRWRPGPVRRADLYDGEVHDVREEPTGWDEPGFDDDAWDEPEVGTWVLPALTPGKPPVRRLADLDVRPVGRSVDGGLLVDLGENIAGRLRVAGHVPAGVEVTLRHAERLAPDGRSLYRDNLRGAEATDRLVGAGGHVEWEPRFTYHGFRYAEVLGPTEVVDALELRGVVTAADVERTGTFRCSHDGLNAFHDAVARSLRNNLVEVPTDCPQRAERLGWTGDIQLFAPVATFLADTTAFLDGWLVDLRDAQLVGGHEDGQYPQYAPRGPQTGGGPGWSDAGIIVPWTLYVATGDDSILARHWPSLRRWFAHLDDRAGGRVPEGAAGFGDWLALDGGPGDTRGATPLELVELAYLVHAHDLGARVAQVLGHGGERDELRRRAQRHRDAFRDAFVRAGGLVPATQTGAALALRFGLLDDGAKRTVAAWLADEVEQRGHLTTGFLGTAHLLDALTLADRGDLAHRLLEREEHPSWLHPVLRHGATTTWERWDGWTDDGPHPHPMNSFDHYAHGAVADWMHRVLGGLAPDPSAPGWGRVLVQPRPGGSVTWARTRCATVRGEVAVEWQVDDDRFEVEVRVPPTSSATITLPDGTRTDVGAGVHHRAARLPGHA